MLTGPIELKQGEVAIVFSVEDSKLFLELVTTPHEIEQWDDSKPMLAATSLVDYLTNGNDNLSKIIDLFLKKVASREHE